MNSAVQCLAHTVPIITQFVGGGYRSAINCDNVLGRGGKLAEAFGSLMDKLWQVLKRSSFTVTRLQNKLSELNKSGSSGLGKLKPLGI